MKYTSCHVDTKLSTWFGLMSSAETKVRSKVCVQQFTAEQSRDDKFAGTPETFFMRCLICRAASGKILRTNGPGHQCGVLACSDRRRNVRGNKWRHHVRSILAVEGCNQWTT